MIRLAPWLAALAVLAAALGVRSVAGEPQILSLVPPAVPEAPAVPRVRRRLGRRRRARSAIDPEVPQLLDLLAAGSSAGLSAELALRRAVEVMDGQLGRDLRALFERADTGARWRDELQTYADGAGSRDLRRAVTVVERTERLGASLADACADIAASVRADRRAARLERARTAPVKMLFPLVFLILPAFLLLTVVPVLLATVGAIA